MYWSTVGRHWIAGAASRPVYFNWRTREVRVEPRGGSPQPDLDDLELRPLTTCPAYAALPARSRRVFEAPYFLDPARGLGLRDCDGGRRRLSRRPVDLIGLAGQVAYWVSGRTLRTYSATSRRRLAVPIPEFDSSFEEPVAVPVARRSIVVAVTVLEDCDRTCSTSESDLFVIRVRR